MIRPLPLRPTALDDVALVRSLSQYNVGISSWYHLKIAIRFFFLLERTSKLTTWPSFKVAALLLVLSFLFGY